MIKKSVLRSEVFFMKGMQAVGGGELQLVSLQDHSPWGLWACAVLTVIRALFHAAG